MNTDKTNPFVEIIKILSLSLLIYLGAILSDFSSDTTNISFFDTLLISLAFYAVIKLIYKSNKPENKEERIAKKIFRSIKKEAFQFHSEIERRFQENPDFNIELLFFVTCAKKHLENIGEEEVAKSLNFIFKNEYIGRLKFLFDKFSPPSITKKEKEIEINNSVDRLLMAELNLGIAYNDRFKHKKYKGVSYKKLIVGIILRNIYSDADKREYTYNRSPKNVNYIYKTMKNIENIVDKEISVKQSE